MTNIELLEAMAKSIETGDFSPEYSVFDKAGQQVEGCGCFIAHADRYRWSCPVDMPSSLTQEIKARFGSPYRYGHVFHAGYLAKHNVTKPIALDIIRAAIKREQS